MITRASVHAFLARDWDRVRARKREHWRARLERGDLAEALRVTELLRRQAQAIHPDWPTAQDREEDLETHRRVAQALLKTPPAQAAKLAATRRPRRVRPRR